MQVETYLSSLVIWHVVVTDPHSEVASLKLCRHQGIELEGGTQAGALFISELGLRKGVTHQLTVVHEHWVTSANCRGEPVYTVICVTS